ncbi:hypothetical protein [Streptomyces qinzhouensis]|uniref:Uncharacterized protein n=1 Tax=Streptomyces qinzhouensis TaxID=2599401 RepID=A0A5B8JA48_9ACTN|nr:hypothetical protein [Streptomyces qinzhouensis]QDY78227.1 hypothetical protein FQU76_18945 [Streptomyces qinzhouensis]
MTDNRNAAEAPRAPAISITVRGGRTRLVVSTTTTIARADHGSRSEALAPGGSQPAETARPPFWVRTSVLWSAVAAVATVATALLTWRLGG